MPRLSDTRARNTPFANQGQSFAWDSEVRGLGLRATPTAKSWIVQLRYLGKEKRISLGRFPALLYEGEGGARDLAITALAAARAGRDPQLAIGYKQTPQGLTLRELWERYQQAGFPKSSGERKRPGTIRADGSRWRCFFDPQRLKEKDRLASKAVSEIDAPCAELWLDTIPDLSRPMAFALLKALLSFAKKRNLATTHDVKVRLPASRRVENYLKAGEIKLLDGALAAIAVDQPERLLSVAACRLLLATGARSGEILALKRASVDLDNKVLRIRGHKGGNDAKDILLSNHACDIIRSIPKTSSVFVFPSTHSSKGHLTAVYSVWKLALSRAQLPSIRVHDARHSFAAAAIAQGVSLPTLAGLLGHAPGSQATSRYAHLQRESKRAALDLIAAATASGKGQGA